MADYQIGFVVEQSLGHRTHGQNLHTILERFPNIEARWVEPTWQQGGLGSRLPFLRGNWTVQAGWQARRGLQSLIPQYTPGCSVFPHPGTGSAGAALGAPLPDDHLHGCHSQTV